MIGKLGKLKRTDIIICGQQKPLHLASHFFGCWCTLRLRCCVPFIPNIMKNDQDGIFADHVITPFLRAGSKYEFYIAGTAIIKTSLQPLARSYKQFIKIKTSFSSERKSYGERSTLYVIVAFPPQKHSSISPILRERVVGPVLYFFHFFLIRFFRQRCMKLNSLTHKLRFCHIQLPS